MYAGADPGGGAPGAPPPKIGKNLIFCVKSWFFTRNTLQILDYFKYAPP